MLLATKLRLDRLGEKLVSQLSERIATTDTGQYLPRAEREKLAASVGYELTDTEFSIYGSEYLYTQETGRRPTVNNGDGAVRRYVLAYIREEGIEPRGQDRNGMPIDEGTLAYFISRKLHEEGGKPWRNRQHTGVISGVINDKLIEQVEALLTEAYTAEIAEYLLEATA
ncbi:hypothetical protein [Pontibacter sp. H249]|uniref:hypothetical protein n=1 Tax=Pontibacter sp. H249 TaxID=3133420 RepID=UPI0030BDD223